METNVSEPLRKCRKRMDGVKTRGWSLTWDKSGGKPAYCPDGVRHKGGVNMILALVWNVGTYPPNVKGETQVGGPHKCESTDAGE
ncbi:MAG: hypothetical protein C5S38_05335 [Candidatus Methanophagaceae archaeon]|nr:MAG: hypothetical protein C5S38_05335 [Methanophagales archaeon]